MSPRHPRIVAFLAAEALSAVGSWATLIVVWGYAAFEFDATATDVSLFGLAFGLPGMVLGPVAGAAVDRFGPKATLAAAKVLGVGASLLLLTADTFTMLGILSALHGIAFTFSLPAIQAMPPRLVADEHLARTNALVSLTDEIAIVVGPVVGAASIAVVGFRGAFVVDAITYALGLVALPLVRLRPAALGEGDTEASSGALEGLRRVWRVPLLRRVVACTFLVHLLYGAALLIEPLYVRDVLGRSEEWFAALQTIFGAALVGGGLVVAKAGERLASFRYVALGLGGSAVAAFIYMGTPWLGAAIVGVVLWGLVTALMGGPSRTVIQRATREVEHGRVLAADLMVGSMGQVVGLATLGIAIDAIGIRSTVFLLGSAVVACAVLLGLADARGERGAAPTTLGAAPSTTVASDGPFRAAERPTSRTFSDRVW